MKTQIKTLFFVVTLFVFMGNKGCENKEARRSGRILKRSASLLGMQARRIYKEGAVDIDLQGILNDQLLSEVNNSDYFISYDQYSPSSFSDQTKKYSDKFGKNFRPLPVNRLSAVCTKDLPEVLIGGAATDFELTTGGGLSIGLGEITKGILPGVDFAIKRLAMGLDLHIFEPLTLTHTGASFSERGVKRDWKIGINLNLGGIGINPVFEFPQEVAKVTRQTLRNALNKLGTHMEKLEFEGQHAPWSARVYAENDSHILVNAGQKHGLKVGDYLWISNMDYHWEGEPCKSRLRFQTSRHTIDKPLAVAEVVGVGVDGAQARLIEESQQTDVVEGAKAFVFKLAEEKAQGQLKDN